MASVGSLNVKVTASTQQFEAGMRRVRGGVNEASKSFNVGIAVARKLKAALAGVASGFAVSKLLSGINSVTDAMNRVNIGAKKLGVSTEFLSAFQFAAKQIAAIDPGRAEVLLTSLATKVSDAAIKGGEAAKVFQLLNIDLQALSKLRVDEQFVAIGKAFNKLDKTTQLNVGKGLFEKEGISAANLFADIPGFIEQLNRAQELGVTVTGKEGSAAEKFQLRMGELVAVMDSLKQTIAVKLAEPLTRLIDAIFSWIAALGGKGDGGAAARKKLEGETWEELIFSVFMDRKFGRQQDAANRNAVRRVANIKGGRRQSRGAQTPFAGFNESLMMSLAQQQFSGVVDFNQLGKVEVGRAKQPGIVSDMVKAISMGVQKGAEAIGAGAERVGKAHKLFGRAGELAARPPTLIGESRFGEETGILGAGGLGGGQGGIRAFTGARSVGGELLRVQTEEKDKVKEIHDLLRRAWSELRGRGGALSP